MFNRKERLMARLRFFYLRMLLGQNNFTLIDLHISLIQLHQEIASDAIKLLINNFEFGEDCKGIKSRHKGKFNYFTLFF